MKRLALLLIGALSLTGSPAQAQSFDFEGAQRCEDAVIKLDWEEGYELGKSHSQYFQEALQSEGWDKDVQKFYLDLSRYESQHGITGMTTKAQLLIAMYFAKRLGEEFDFNGTTNTCLIGEFRIYRNRAWSAVHSGFTENLSPKLKALYFSLPAQ